MGNFLNVILIALILVVWWDSRRSLIKAIEYYEKDFDILENIKEALNEIRKITNG